MHTLATKLMGQKSSGQPQAISAIFGQLSGQTKLLSEILPQFRVGMWPILSETAPEVAMGLAGLLAYALERWPSIRVYRLVAKIEDNSQVSAWTIADSQFGVDDWELDGLDENVAIWGEYRESGDGISLTLAVENDFAEDAESLFSKTWEARELSEIVAVLPEIAADIAEYLDAGQANSILPLYDTSAKWNTVDLEKITQLIFRWELNLYQNLAGNSWGEQEIISNFQKLIATSTNLRDGLGGWITGNAATRLLSRLYQPQFNFFSTYISKLDVASLTPEFVVTVATALYHLGENLGAFYLLESVVEMYPQVISARLALAEVYLAGGEQGPALNVYQEAIQAGVLSSLLYNRYAELLLAFDANNIVLVSGTENVTASGRPFVEQYILINPEQITEDQLLHEAIAAYFEALNLAPDNLELRSHLLLNLADLGDQRLWREFEELVKRDMSGSLVRTVIDGMYGLDDLSVGIEVLSKAVQENPNRVDLYLNLALLYLQADEPDAALDKLAKARTPAGNDSQILSEIDRLRLHAENPDLEQQLAEISDLISVQSEISDAQIELLENAIEDAPAMVDLYILLATAYIQLDEVSSALDVLLECQKISPENPQLAVQLAKVFWKAGETELAFECLNKALAKNRNYVPLLALTGQFLFEDGQDEEAKAFLARAEALDSQDSVLRDARVAISKLI